MRAAKKAVSFTFIHFLVGLAVAYALTGQFVIAAGVALVEPLVSGVVHYFHDRWHEAHAGGGRPLAA
ncbi:MAG: DUF2061 domain-containing protein [Parvibaculum sp.]|uniref:DUF2061 domain-containing protein n=1 Tax=Parvibaculum sp. TaxID=2024848 RepID=UPI003C74554B